MWINELYGLFLIQGKLESFLWNTVSLIKHIFFYVLLVKWKLKNSFTRTLKEKTYDRQILSFSSMKPKNDILNYIQKRERKEGRDKGRKVDRAMMTYFVKDCAGQWKFWFGKVTWLIKRIIILPTPGAWLKVSLPFLGWSHLSVAYSSGKLIPPKSWNVRSSLWQRVPSLYQNEFFP